MAVMACALLVPLVNASGQAGTCPMRVLGSKKIAYTIVGSWSGVQAVRCLAGIMSAFFREKDVRHSIYFNPKSFLQYTIGYLQYVCPQVIEAAVYAGIAYVCLNECEKPAKGLNTSPDTQEVLSHY